MTKGIRNFAKEMFNASLPQLPEMGYTLFRQTVRAQILMAFEDCTPNSASTHFNKALIDARKEVPHLLEGYGRPADKKGGRKSNASVEAANAVLVDVVKVKTGEVVVGAIARGAATQLIIKAAAAKKAKLAIREAVTA